ncbi:hypothetical protein [Aquimarina longa]|uniref:hypothetical protein n=1 Tax=Aquimarina longa TaxID=1080221 RepID=UPI0007832A4C|nr:hypothetical protein [Aquimarina longa]
MIIKKIFCAVTVYFTITSFSICCKPLPTDLNDNNLVEKQVKTWQKVSDDFLLKEGISKPEILYNYMKNSFRPINFEEKELDSYKKAILNFTYANYKNKIINNDFFIAERMSQHGLSYTLILNTEGKNLIMLGAFQGELNVKGKQESSILDFEKKFNSYKPFDKCEVNNNPNRYTILNKFSSNGDIEIKVVDRQCRGEYK